MPRIRFAAGKLSPRRPQPPRLAVGLLAPLRRLPALPGERGRIAKAKHRRPGHPVPFLVGKIDRRGNRGMMVLDDATPPPIPGPWELKAVFSKDPAAKDRPA